ncbi:MerR family transcriptional regulator [Neobacillus muris]|uniref:MerR family transcriptional regulator n=1 Tax=Neobacillus muris TaxID=2941334 RepID=UPI00203A8038|nr:MerR family transcriptional regulator [Neobacillus muris]
MFSISEVSKKTGFSAHTLRYYEKIGLLSKPDRSSGQRKYSEGDIRLLQFMKVLKNTGMSLENIQQFLIDGCILETNQPKQEKSTKVHKRIDILQRHLVSLQKQKEELEMVIKLTVEKLAIYQDMLQEDRSDD